MLRNGILLASSDRNAVSRMQKQVRLVVPPQEATTQKEVEGEEGVDGAGGEEEGEPGLKSEQRGASQS